MNEVYDISGESNAPNLPIEDIENERQTLIGMLVDSSGSMQHYTDVMKACLTKFKYTLINSKQEDEMLVSLTTFGGNGIKLSGYQLIEDLPTDYRPSGLTPLYDAIVQAQKHLYDGKGGGYLEQLQANGIKVKGILVIFSDGDDTSSACSVNETRQAISLLKQKEIIVAFVSFGFNAQTIATSIGIDPQNVLEVTASESELRKVFEVLSKSAISASQNAAAGQSSNAFFV